MSNDHHNTNQGVHTTPQPAEEVSQCPELNPDSFAPAIIPTDHSIMRGPQCWLCGRRDFAEDLFVPCECPSTVGLIHKQCLLDWINTLYKGRCPRCAFMFRVMTDHTPWVKWRADPLLYQRRTRHIVAVIVHCVFMIFTLLVISLLLHPVERDKERSKFKVVLAILMGLTYLIYFFYQIRVYMRVYERLKIFNNRVRDVIDIQEARKKPDCQVRGNLSSLINQSEMQQDGDSVSLP